MRSEEYDEKNIVQTDHGYAVRLEAEPSRRDLLWLKMPEEHIYFYDGDGWYRLSPAEIWP